MTEQEAIKRCGMLVNGFSVNHATYEAFTEDGKGYPTFNTMKEFAETCKYALDEIQEYRAIGTVEEIKSFFNENRKAGYKHGYADGYVKAIDEFVERMFRICDDRGTKICAISNAPLYAHEDGTWHSLIRDVAEQMKGGAVCTK